MSDPLVTAAVAAIAIDDFNIGETMRWGNLLAAEARRWLSRGGYTPHQRRLTKRDAENIWQRTCLREVSHDLLR